MTQDVCTISQGEKLISFGLCNSRLSWFARKLFKEEEYKNIIGNNTQAWNKETAYSYYSEIQLAPAFTSGELGELMPNKYFTRKSEHGWNVYEIREGELTMPLINWSETEAEARADIIIYLLENHIMHKQ